MKIKIITLTLCFLITPKSIAAQEHHNLQADNCRAFSNGGLQIVGKSDTDGASKIIIINPSYASEKVIDRFLSLCMATKMSRTKLRIDYLDCSPQGCYSTPETTVYTL